MGFVLLTGYDRYRMYFKDAIGKLAMSTCTWYGRENSRVPPNPTCGSDMSPEDRQESAWPTCRPCGSGYRTEAWAARSHLEPQDAIDALRQRLRCVGKPQAGGDMAKRGR